MIGKLEDSKKALAEAVAGVNDAEARQAPEPGKWSILEIVEHLAVTERGMFSGFAAGETVEVPLGSLAKAAERFETVSAGERKFEAPERARPTGRFPDLDHALAAFVAARQETMDFAVKNEAKLDSMTGRHPLAGLVSGYELLMIMAGHTMRHTKQIWAIRS